MKSLRGVSFLLLGTIVFNLFASGWGEPINPLNNGKFCVPKDGVDDGKLQKNLDWACGQNIDCGPIQPGGICAEPATVKSRATFAMNSYYRTRGGIDSACDFSGTAQTTTTNPSYGNCKYI